MNELKALYQEDSKGKPRVWYVTVNGADVTVNYGLAGGKIATQTTTATPKNVGKANETTAEQQAMLEAQSKWNHQVNREDYHWDILQAGKQLRPMLARDYTKVGHQVDFVGGNWFVQPKLDGLRLTHGWRISGVGEPELLTRKGEVYKVPHIEWEANRLLGIIQNLTDSEVRGLDGELYLHGMPLNEINKRAKKNRGDETERLQYHLFDLVILDMPFSDRYNLLIEALDIYNETFGFVFAEGILHLVPTYPCLDDADLKVWHGRFATQGYEGVMVRNINSNYGMSQRPNCLYKYKEFMDAEFKITDVWADKNGCAMFTCVTEDWNTFDCTPKRTHDERREMVKDPEKYVGQWLTVKFQAWTAHNVPEFPVGLDIRECDDGGNPIA